jgi:hypothetical protein
MVEGVAEAFESLEPAERETATIFTGDYGEASAINFHGKKHGLPRATSGYMTHYLWGPDETRPGPVLLVNPSREALDLICEAPVQVARIVHEVAMESSVAVYLCREHAPLRSVWPQLKRYAHGGAR